MDTLFFWVSKLLWFLISPLNFILVCLCLLWFLLITGKTSHLGLFFSLILGSVLIIAFLPLGHWMLYPLEKRFTTNPDLPPAVGGIIVLSGALSPDLSRTWNQIEVNGAIERELTFMRLAERFPDVALIYSGGSSRLVNNDAREADLAKQLFQQQGLDITRIQFERESRNTYENAVNSLPLTTRPFTEPWILVTSAFHMPRSVGIFCKLDWPVIAYPVDHRTRPPAVSQLSFNLGGHLGMLDVAIHEWLGLLAYRLSGKSNKLLPGQECN